MVTFLVIVILVVAVLLTLVVLAQNSKGGGLTEMGGASQVIGAQRSTDWIEKATWGLSIGLFALCLLVNVFIDRENPNAGPVSPNIERAKSSVPSISAPLPSGGDESVVEPGTSEEAAELFDETPSEQPTTDDNE